MEGFLRVEIAKRMSPSLAEKTLAVLCSHNEVNQLQAPLHVPWQAARIKEERVHISFPVAVACGLYTLREDAHSDAYSRRLIQIEVRKSSRYSHWDTPPEEPVYQEAVQRMFEISRDALFTYGVITGETDPFWKSLLEVNKKVSLLPDGYSQLCEFLKKLYQ